MHLKPSVFFSEVDFYAMAVIDDAEVIDTMTMTVQGSDWLRISAFYTPQYLRSRIQACALHAERYGSAF